MTSNRAIGTYVYCLVASSKRPSLRRRPRQMPGMGPLRMLEMPGRPGRWLVVADAPLGRYGAAAIDERLGDLDWVSRAAVAHEAVVEAFDAATAVLPMKLFTLFSNDERALAEVVGNRRRIERLVKRVARQQEWGVRVTLDRETSTDQAKTPAAEPPGGVAYLAAKKRLRDRAVELSARASRAVADLYDRLAASAKLARRRPASELPVNGGPLLLDAAFLVPRTRASRFRATVRKESRRLGDHGYRVVLTGPWPPYTFVKD
jgi:hypothetical protein